MKYTGMIIGGPKDGQIWTHVSDHMQLVALDAPNFSSYRDSEAAQSLTYQTITYRHMIGLRGEFSLDFWVSTEEFQNDIGKVLEHVFQNYREYANIKRHN